MKEHDEPVTILLKIPKEKVATLMRKKRRMEKKVAEILYERVTKYMIMGKEQGEEK